MPTKHSNYLTSTANFIKGISKNSSWLWVFLIALKCWNLDLLHIYLDFKVLICSTFKIKLLSVFLKIRFIITKNTIITYLLLTKFTAWNLFKLWTLKINKLQ